MMDDSVSSDASLEEAKVWLRHKALKDGARCPCCNQWTQVYKYSFHKGMGKALAYICSAYEFGRVPEDGYFHVEHYLKELKVKFHGYHSKLKFWDMLEARINTANNKKWSGYWKVNQCAFDFLAGRIEVPKYAYLFNNTCLKHSDETVSIHDVMKSPFDYSEMLKGLINEQR